jgi:hypothetical protein
MVLFAKLFQMGFVFLNQQDHTEPPIYSFIIADFFAKEKDIVKSHRLANKNDPATSVLEAGQGIRRVFILIL